MLSAYRLPNHIEGEKIIKVIRRDLFILFKKTIFNLFLLILPIGVFIILYAILPELLTDALGYPLLVLFGSAYYLFVWLFFFFSFIDYYLDVWIITSERIIDIEQHGFFSRVISEQRLYRIQDVTSEIHGTMPTILKFGNVFVQTAGARERFFFNQIPNPDEIRNTIIKLAETSREKHRRELSAEEAVKLQERLDLNK